MAPLRGWDGIIEYLTPNPQTLNYQAHNPTNQPNSRPAMQQMGMIWQKNEWPQPLPRGYFAQLFGTPNRYFLLQFFPMKKIFFCSLLLAVLAAPAAHAQAPAWASVQATPLLSAPDAAGNRYATGSFTGSVTLGSSTLTSSGPAFYVAKWLSASGTYAWAVQAGGSIYPAQNGNPIPVVASGGNVYLAGTFSSPTATFGPTTLTNANPGVAYALDMFVAKIVDAGTSAHFAWALGASAFDVEPNALAVSGGNVYVGGIYGGLTAHFGTIALTNGQNFSAYVAKIADAGASASFGWAQGMGSNSQDEVLGLAASGTALYVASRTYFSTPTVFGSPGPVAPCVSVVRLTDNGPGTTFNWLAAARGLIPNTFYNSLSLYAPLVLNGSNLYLAGTYTNQATIGSTTLPGGSNAVSLFVARLTDSGPAGTFAWATAATGPSTSFVRPTALAVTGSNVYVAGFFQGAPVSFGSTRLATNDPNPNKPDVFVARLTDTGTAGAFAWARSAGAVGSYEAATDVAATGNRVEVCGTTDGATVPFAPLTLINAVAPPAYGSFLASLLDPALAAAAAAAAPLASLYPNPAHGTATLHLPAGAARQPLTLLDALGREARCYPAPTAAATPLDLRGLPAGLYMLRGAELGSQRLVVE